MGWHDALLQLGIPYDSEEALALAEEVMQFVQDKANQTSLELGRERGPFLAFPEPRYDPAHPYRNSPRTTVSPPRTPPSPTRARPGASRTAWRNTTGTTGQATRRSARRHHRRQPSPPTRRSTRYSHRLGREPWLPQEPCRF